MGIREQIVASVGNYIVVKDGQFMYPVQKSDLHPGDSEEKVRGMSAGEYADWCQNVPADLRFAEVGTQECIELCNALIAKGAEVWSVG